MDINSNIKFLGKNTFQCDMCKTNKMKAPYYQRTSIITKLKSKICQSCALREGFGSKYKQNPKYKRWLIKKGE